MRWAVVQARMGSSRLPSKVLADIDGAPMLDRVLDRLARAERIDGVLVATTTSPLDDQIARFADDRGVPIVRGSQDDVLDRYHDALEATGAEVLVRITSDCPLIDPGVVDEVVAALDEDVDYVSNTLEPRTFPRGLDVEAFPARTLRRAWREDDDPAWREHVTPYIYRHPERFRLRGVTSPVDHSAHRWTVDTPEDLELVRRIYLAFGHDRFDWRDVLALLDQHPDWRELNAHVAQKRVR